MAEKDVIKNFKNYLKAHNIYHTESIGIEDRVREITMVLDAKNAPDKYVEGCVWWNGEEAEVRTYYNAMGAEICSKSGHIDELLRLLNFINARVFLNCGEWSGLYKPHMLYTPRIYLTEDGFSDIAITTICSLDFWELTPLETADYITIYCPELLDKLAPAIFGVLLGEVTGEESIAYVKKKILNETGYIS